MTTKIKWDAVGTAVSGLCVVHCAALPVALLVLPGLGTLLPADEGTVHTVLLGLVVVSAGMSFVPGYRTHKHKLPFALSLLGIASLLFAGNVAHEILGHQWEPPFAILGSILLILAHWVNHSKCKSCTTHSCTAESAETVEQVVETVEHVHQEHAHAH